MERKGERKIEREGKQLYRALIGLGMLTWVLGVRFFVSKSQE